MSKLFDLNNEENTSNKNLLDIAIESLDNDTNIKSDVIITSTSNMLEVLKKLSNEDININSRETLLTYNLCVESLGLNTVDELNSDILKETLITVENGFNKYLSNEGFFDNLSNVFKTTSTILSELNTKIKKADNVIEINTDALSKLNGLFLKYGNFGKSYDLSKFSLSLTNELYANIDYTESFDILENNLKEYESAGKVKLDDIAFKDPTKIKNEKLKQLIKSAEDVLEDKKKLFLLSGYYETVSIFNTESLSDKLIDKIFNKMTIKVLVAEEKDGPFSFLAGTSLYKVVLDKFKSPKINNDSDIKISKTELLKIVSVLEDSLKYSKDLAKNYKSKFNKLKLNKDARLYVNSMYKQSLTDHNDFRKNLIKFINTAVKE